MDVLGFPDGSVVKNLPAMQETWVQSLSQENTLEKETRTRSSILAWEIPRTEAPWWAIGHEVAKELDKATRQQQ